MRISCAATERGFAPRAEAGRGNTTRVARASLTTPQSARKRAARDDASRARTQQQRACAPKLDHWSRQEPP